MLQKFIVWGSSLDETINLLSQFFPITSAVEATCYFAPDVLWLFMFPFVDQLIRVIIVGREILHSKQDMVYTDVLKLMRGWSSKVFDS